MKLRLFYTMRLPLLVAFSLTAFNTIAPTYSAQAQRSQYDLAAWLNAAADEGDTTNAIWALKEGLDINYKRGNGPALFIAISKKRPQMVNFLLRHGANPQVTNEEGLSAIQFAEKVGHAEIIALLKGHPSIKGAPVKKADDNKVTPPPQQPIISGQWKVGDIVLHSRNRGKTWEEGTVLKISTDPNLTTDGQPVYLVENKAKTVQNYYDANFLTTLQRQAVWTSFFVGDWDLYLPMAGGDRIIGSDVYTIYAGGDKLPPLRINPNGTYSWALDKKKVIRGKWKANTNAPGIILLNGDKNENWLIYNTTDATNKKIHKADYIMISSNKNSMTKHGFRIK